MPSLPELNEKYLRADQEWRLARSRSIVKYRGEGSDLVVSALADGDTEALCRNRLEALVAVERAKDEATLERIAAEQAFLKQRVELERGWAEPVD